MIKNLLLARTYVRTDWYVSAMLHCSQFSRATRNAPTRGRAIANTGEGLR